MGTAQETFARMLRYDVAPLLREMGFRGSGQNFSVPNASHWALLDFQRSAWSYRHRLTFTANMTVVSRDEWSASTDEYPGLSRRPGANWSPAPIFTRVWETGYWHSRIGMVMPERLDTWWEVVAGDETARVAEEVIAAIREYGLPAMHERMVRGSQ